jgi:hypothetical protein
MPLKETERYDEFFVRQMKSVFGDDIELIESAENYKVRGWFTIKFWHRPTKLYIIIEADYGRFVARFEQEDGCFAHLYQIQRFERRVSEKNIEAVVDLIKTILYQPITFYKATGEGLYRKEGDKYIRLSREELTEYAHGNTAKNTSSNSGNSN